MLDFDSIKEHYPEEDWDIGYISRTEFKRTVYSPIKESMHPYGHDFTGAIHIPPNIKCGLVFIRKGETYDYTHYDECTEIFSKIPEVNSREFTWGPAYLNFKQAALFAGLGVRARNSLIYSYKFGFDHHIACIALETELVNVPTNRKYNPANKRGDLWPNCVGCYDCVDACPVGAIHAREGEEPFWLDSEACDTFITFGNHDRIPSIKQFTRDHLYPDMPDEILEKITDVHVAEEFSKQNNIPGFYIPGQEINGVVYDGQVTRVDGIPVNVPFCRECTAQPRCSKYDGEFPYEKFVAQSRNLAETRRKKSETTKK